MDLYYIIQNKFVIWNNDSDLDYSSFQFHCQSKFSCWWHQSHTSDNGVLLNSLFIVALYTFMLSCMLRCFQKWELIDKQLSMYFNQRYINFLTPYTLMFIIIKITIAIFINVVKILYSFFYKMKPFSYKSTFLFIKKYWYNYNIMFNIDMC